MPVDPDVRAVLLRAADLVERGWCQGGTGAETKHGDETEATSENAVSFCALAAIENAAFAVGNVCLPREVENALIQVTGPGVIHWNDAPGRTQAEVVSALRRAAGGEDAK